LDKKQVLKNVCQGKEQEQQIKGHWQEKGLSNKHMAGCLMPSI
jgi:hypothetical protein